MTDSADRHIVAVVATYGRPRECERLLESLDGVETVFVCDNSARDDVRKVVESSPIRARYLAPGGNLGCGGGLRFAEEQAWREIGGQMTHLLVLDDDAVLQPDTLRILANAMDRERAIAAYPLITGEGGRVAWTPGLRDRRLHLIGKSSLTPEEYRRRLGQDVAEFEWAQGICLLARREAVEKAGFHRGDFWVRGEDLDFSLRLSSVGRCLLVANSLARHLPPPGVPSTAVQGEYLRHAALVQNMAFLAFTQSHGKRVRRSVSSEALRFIRMWGFKSVPDAIRALRRGAGGVPAGAGDGQSFRKRFNDLSSR